MTIQEIKESVSHAESLITDAAYYLNQFIDDYDKQIEDYEEIISDLRDEVDELQERASELEEKLNESQAERLGLLQLLQNVGIPK